MSENGTENHGEAEGAFGVGKECSWYYEDGSHCANKSTGSS